MAHIEAEKGQASKWSSRLTNVSSKDEVSDAHRDTQPKLLRRIFSFLQLLFLSLAYMSGWESPVDNLYAPFYNGGPQVLFWGTVIVWIGALAQSASLAELSSILPIAGAQYHWTAVVAPKRFRKFITYLQGQRLPVAETVKKLTDPGWLTWLAWLALLAGILSVTVNLIEGTIILNDPDKSFEPWQSFLMMMAVLFFLFIVNIYFFDTVPWIELLSGIFHIAMFFVYMGVLLGLTEEKHSADFVFFSRVNSTTTSGWNSDVVSWHLGLLTPIWTFCGFDAAIHLSEEVNFPRLSVPRVIFWSIFSNGIFALVMIVTTLYCAGDVLSTALESPFPFATIALQATGSLRAANAMAVGLIFMCFAGSLSSLVSASRLTYAWARDSGFGKTASPYFAVLNDKRIPHRAVTLSCVATALLSLPNVKSTIAFAALTSLSTLALYLSYAVAVACMLLNRFSSSPVTLGEWNLGRYGAVVNLYALVHSLYMAFWLPWPSTIPVNAQNMNWAGPITVAVLMLAGLGYIFVRKEWGGVDEKVVERVVKES